MFKFTVLLLLCAAVIATHGPWDMLRGCVANPGGRQTPGKCFLVPERELRTNERYMMLAEAILQTHADQSPASRLNTIFNISRVGHQVRLLLLMYNVRRGASVPMILCGRPFDRIPENNSNEIENEIAGSVASVALLTQHKLEALLRCSSISAVLLELT
ncbi:hypothetical protein MTO96_033496 [Rhipicephalus appendiculatus]